ncbi:hypothetical protein MUK42_34771 [Musa troglodytarum]|uniref:Uncharacterized protein n=1 Tax=Musa troglodytarum TaxID=320322 RepID=A0A9E7EJE5_9LILI|nr:hypothetical protein MUK42_34771 [Musa troglodytarum]
MVPDNGISSTRLEDIQEIKKLAVVVAITKVPSGQLVPMISNKAPSTVSSMVSRASLRKCCGLTLEALNETCRYRKIAVCEK